MMHKKPKFPVLDGKNLRIGIVVARWNNELTYALKDDAIKGLLDANVLEKNIIVQDVPGAYELVFGAKRMIAHHNVDAVICIGILIKGETYHFEYISEAVTNGIMNLSLTTDIPVVYGILNTKTLEQATIRSTGAMNHGYDWGKTAVEMGLKR